MRRLEATRLDFSEFVRPGDCVVWGQCCGEPVSLSEQLLAQRHSIGRFNVLLGGCFSSSIQPEHADCVRFSGFAGVGSNRRLVKANAIDILPSHISSIDRYLLTGVIPCDVAIVQVSLPNANGEYSLGLTSDYIRTAVDTARMVIAEVNSKVPQTICESPLTAGDIDVLVEVDRDPIEVSQGSFGDVEQKIAAYASIFIPDRATLQMGNGAIPNAILATLTTRRGLGIHSGMVGDSVAELMRAGIVTNEHKEVDTGYTVTGCLMGTAELYRFMDRNEGLKMCSVPHTHGPSYLSKLSRFTSINSAIEVDLTGQINAEAIHADYVGSVGGQVDYVRAASASPGGCSIIALTATAKGGASRIVSALSGPVTTPRSDAGVIVTEFGAADLRGKTLSQRARALIDIADPQHRERLGREAHALMRVSV